MSIPVGKRVRRAPWTFRSSPSTGAQSRRPAPKGSTVARVVSKQRRQRRVHRPGASSLSRRASPVCAAEPVHRRPLHWTQHDAALSPRTPRGAAGRPRAPANDRLQDALSPPRRALRAHSPRPRATPGSVAHAILACPRRTSSTSSPPPRPTSFGSSPGSTGPVCQDAHLTVRRSRRLVTSSPTVSN